MELSTFNFDAAAVRVQVDDLGQPWFNATDVCDALGMGNPSQAIKSHVDAEDLQKLETLSAGGNQLQNHINESGLYSLIMGSRKPEAKRFKRWVTSEVLPSIRKTGAYVSADAIASPIQNGAADLLFKSVEAGITPKSQANLIVKAMALSSAPGAADILAALERQAAAGRASQAPAQAQTTSQSPLPLPVPENRPKSKPARKPTPIKIGKIPFGGLDGCNFIVEEIAPYVVGGMPELKRAMRDFGLINETGVPTSKGRGLVTRKGVHGHHWKVAELLRFVSGRA